VAAARGAPAIERLKERGIEVLLLGERIDEWAMAALEGYEGKRFKDATRGELELGGLISQADRQQHDAQLKESKGLLKRIKDALGTRVTEVRVSERLKDSPACLVLGEQDVPERMRRILAAAGQKIPEARPVIEVNVAHPLVGYLEGISDAGQFAELAQLLYDQAALAEGAPLANAPEYVQRLNRLLVRLAAPPAAAS
jgi:molecular chaperone HtpG